MAPPEDKVFDRELKCVRKGSGTYDDASLFVADPLQDEDGEAVAFGWNVQVVELEAEKEMLMHESQVESACWENQIEFLATSRHGSSSAVGNEWM